MKIRKEIEVEISDAEIDSAILKYQYQKYCEEENVRTACLPNMYVNTMTYDEWRLAQYNKLPSNFKK